MGIIKKSNVYLLKVSPDGIYKIGVAKNVNRRVKQLQTGNPEKIEIIRVFPTNYPFKIESYLHRKHSYNHVQGECYYMSEQDIKDFDETCSLCERNFEIMENINNEFDMYY